jgi:hypothetical protein
MCVINLGKRVKGPVVGWKLLRKDGERLYGILDFPYKVGVYHNGQFEAFVKKSDALKSITHWSGSYVVMRVHLYNAAKGRIEGMDDSADDCKGYHATRIRILPVRKRGA